MGVTLICYYNNKPFMLLSTIYDTLYFFVT